MPRDGMEAAWTPGRLHECPQFVTKPKKVSPLRNFFNGQRPRMQDRLLRQSFFEETGEPSFATQQEIVESLSHISGISPTSFGLPRKWFDALDKGFFGEIFAKESQAEKSDHNLLHGYVVMTTAFLSGLTINALHLADKVKYPYYFSQTQLLALATAGLLHDTQRVGDIKESLLKNSISRHMVLAYEAVPKILGGEKYAQLEKIVEESGENYDDFTDLVALLCRHHGTETGEISEDDKKRHPRLLELVDTIRFADAKALQRLFISHHLSARIAAGYINETRNHKVLHYFAQNDIEKAAEISELFGRFATMLDTVSQHHLGVKDKKHPYKAANQKEVFKSLLSSLGLLTEGALATEVRRSQTEAESTWEGIGKDPARLIKIATQQIQRLFLDH
ncbi:MAG TPA: hypothetical protein VN711_02195 [Candidatus Saccharimonadales bacterium]|nr:hypothetical protein [Candidatus Saccharimonadales bacterium]